MYYQMIFTVKMASRGYTIYAKSCREAVVRGRLAGRHLVHLVLDFYT